MKINIIEMQYETQYWGEDMFPEIKYFDSFNGLELVKKANEIYTEALGEEERTTEEMIRNWFNNEKELEEFVQQYREDYIDEEDWEYYDGLEDFINEDEGYFLDELFGGDTEIIEDFFKANDLVFNTVGYSPWSFVLYPKDLKHDYVNDIYEGWNFYSIATLDAQGDVIDSIGFVYLGDDSYTLEDAVKDNFGIEDFFLVDNEDSKYIDHKKVNKIAHVEYSFEVI